MTMQIKRLVFNNFGLKVTALFLAIFVWVMVSGKARSYSEKIFDANVEYVNVAQNLDVRTVHPEKVRVTARGTSKTLSRITADDFRIRIDLNNITEASYLSRSAEDYLDIPEGIEVKSVYPRMIEITIKEFIHREIPVRVRYKGKLPRGVRLIDRKVVPEKVNVLGYKSEIGGIAEFEVVEDVKLDDLWESKTIRIPLKKDKAVLRYEDAEAVDVVITIENINKKKEEEDKAKEEKSDAASKSQGKG